MLYFCVYPSLIQRISHLVNSSYVLSSGCTYVLQNPENEPENHGQMPGTHRPKLTGSPFAHGRGLNLQRATYSTILRRCPALKQLVHVMNKMLVNPAKLNHQKPLLQRKHQGYHYGSNLQVLHPVVRELVVGDRVKLGGLGVDHGRP